jgi:hypothetical protein
LLVIFGLPDAAPEHNDIEGVNTHPKLRQSRFGHSSIKTTLDIYGQLYEPVDEVTADRIEELLPGAITHETRTERASGL